MDQRFRAFVLAAETLSMSRAAEKAFVTPQCISNHIHSLELEYGVRLFIRRPRLALTPEGRHLLSALYEIQMLEDDIANSLNGNRAHSETIGRVSLGVPISRYTAFVPEILSGFRKEYPLVELQVEDAFSEELAHQVESGKLDMAIVSQQEKTGSLDIVMSVADRFFFLLPRSLLKQKYPQTMDASIRQFEKGITMEQISQFPLITYPLTSRLRQAMERYGIKNGTVFNSVFESNHMEVFDSLVRTLNAAGIVAEQMLPLTVKTNRAFSVEEKVYAFPIRQEELELPFFLSLICRKSGYLCDYKRFLRDLLCSILRKMA